MRSWSTKRRMPFRRSLPKDFKPTSLCTSANPPLSELLPVAAYHATLDGTITQATTALVSLLRAPGESSVLGTRISDYCVRLGDKSRILDNLHTASRLMNRLAEIRTFDQTTRWVRVSDIPVHDTLGCVVSRRGLLQDVTNWKTAHEAADRAQKRLAALQTLLQVLSQSAPDCISGINTAKHTLHHLTGSPCAILVHHAWQEDRMATPHREEYTGWEDIPAAFRQPLRPWVESCIRTGRSFFLPEDSDSPTCVALPSTLAALPEPLRGHTCFAILPIIGHSENVGVIVLHISRSDGVLSREDLPFFQSVASCLGSAIESAHLRHDAALERMRGQHLSKVRINAQESERARIARELHDEIGQALTALEFSVENVKRSVSVAAFPKLRAGLQDVGLLTSSLHESIRELSHGLRPSILDDIGLKAALEWYIHTSAKRLGFLSTLEVVGIDPSRLPSTLETMLYRITQEAVTNAARHAHPTRITVRIVRTALRVIWSFVDDGQGFDVSEALGDGCENRGIGLLDMQERVNLLGGRFRIRSAKGEGTALHAEIPCTEATATMEATGGIENPSHCEPSFVDSLFEESEKP